MSLKIFKGFIDIAFVWRSFKGPCHGNQFLKRKNRRFWRTNHLHCRAAIPKRTDNGSIEKESHYSTLIRSHNLPVKCNDPKRSYDQMCPKSYLASTDFSTRYLETVQPTATWLLPTLGSCCIRSLFCQLGQLSNSKRSLNFGRTQTEHRNLGFFPMSTINRTYWVREACAPRAPEPLTTPQ